MMDLAASAVLLSIASAGALAWKTVGRARSPRFERVDRAGRSVFLGAGPQRSAYWAAQPVGRALVRAGVSANAVTFASIPLAAIGGLAFATGHYGVGALGAAASFACDALDGLVARQAGTASQAGEIVDAACDRVAEALLFAGITVAWRASVPLLVLVLGAALGAQQVTLASTKAEVYPQAARAVPRGLMRRAERAVCMVLGATASGILVDVLPASAGAWAAAPIAVAMAVVAVVGNASAVHRFVILARTLKSHSVEARHAAE